MNFASAVCLGLILTSAPAFAAERFACPPWEIVVTDEQGQPLPGCAVMQEWGAKAGKLTTNSSATAVTDARGRAQFPARNLRPPVEATFLRRAARHVDGTGPSEVWANVFVGREGHRGLWIRAWNDPLIIATKTFAHTSDGPVPST